MKLCKLMYIPLFAILLTGCNNAGTLKYDTYDPTLYNANVNSEGYTVIDFYTINDFHGALTYDEESSLPGLGRLTSFLKTKRSANPGGTVFIANGDMWQGSADSNLTRGEIVVHAMNHLSFDVMTIGNHEFDWTIDTIVANKAKSNFPYLGGNIVNKSDGKIVDFVDESPLIERDGVKIGVIGTIGSDLENTIQSGLIRDIEFGKITEYVEQEAARLRAIGANLVVLAAHDTWVSNVDIEREPIINEKMVDAVFTGHQHVIDEQFINGIPILQGRAYGRDVQYVSLGYHKTNNEVKLLNRDVIEVVEEVKSLGLKADKTAEQIYKHFYQKANIGKIKNEKIGKITGETMSKIKVANFAVEVMAKSYLDEAVGAFHNVNGGIRAEFNKGNITYGDIYQAFPFDNEIYLVRMRGSRIKALTGGNYAYYYSVDRSTLVDNEYYYLVTTNFISEMDGSPAYGLEYINKFTYPRDLIAEYIRTHKTINGKDY